MLKQCASWLQTKQVLYENTRLRPSFLRRKVAKLGARIEQTMPPGTEATNGSWRVDETFVRVKGKWVYLCRAVDSTGHCD